jgi:hypothetical protein
MAARANGQQKNARSRNRRNLIMSLPFDNFTYAGIHANVTTSWIMDD